VTQRPGRRRGKHLVTLGVVALLVCAAGCTRQISTSVSLETLRIAIPITPTNLNPILQQNQIESSVDGLIFNKLVTIDNHGNDLPDLAAVVPTTQNGGISKNGLTITYHLRHGVRWQDGVPFTSADVKFTWDEIMNDANNVLNREGYDDIASIDTPDPYTVVLHMKRVFPPEIDTFFAESDTAYEILPKHLLAGYANINQIPFNSDPLGTGPYRFVRWIRGQEIDLVANPHYFRGAPHIKNIRILIVPDQNTMETLMRSGEVDVDFEIPALYLHQLADDPALVPYLANAPSWQGIMFNTARPPLNDLRVRQALSMGIDRAAVIRDTNYGIGTIANADLTPFSWAYDRNLKPTPYDPSRARALLDAAGWTMGPDGIRVRDGRPLSLELAYGQGSVGAQNAVEQVQQQLRAIGVAVSLKSFDYALYYAAEQAGGILLSGKYDLALYAWIAGADPNNADQWICAAIPPNGNNAARYCSAQMDAAQRVALSTFDRVVRKRAYARIETLLEIDAPCAFITDIPQRYVLTRRLRNFKPNGISEGWNAQQWQLQP
jgi:peptide/nickel transport system substrate-binding protein